MDLGVIGQGAHVHFPEIQGRGTVAAFAADWLVAKIINANIAPLLHNCLLVDEGEEEVEAVEVIVGEDVTVCVVVLRHDDLFGSEECSELVIEVHFLLVASRIVADP